MPYTLGFLSSHTIQTKVHGKTAVLDFHHSVELNGLIFPQVHSWSQDQRLPSFHKCLTEWSVSCRKKNEGTNLDVFTHEFPDKVKTSSLGRICHNCESSPRSSLKNPTCWEWRTHRHPDVSLLDGLEARGSYHIFQALCGCDAGIANGKRTPKSSTPLTEPAIRSNQPFFAVNSKKIPLL